MRGGGETSRRKYPQKWPKIERDLGDAPTSFGTLPVTVVGFVEGYQVVVVVVGTAYRPNNSRRDTVSPFFLLFPWRRLLARSLRGIRCSRAGFVTPEALKGKRGSLPLLPVSAAAHIRNVSA